MNGRISPGSCTDFSSPHELAPITGNNQSHPLKEHGAVSLAALRPVICLPDSVIIIFKLIRSTTTSDLASGARRFRRRGMSFSKLFLSYQLNKDAGCSTLCCEKAILSVAGQALGCPKHRLQCSRLPLQEERFLPATKRLACCWLRIQRPFSGVAQALSYGRRLSLLISHDYQALGW